MGDIFLKILNMSLTASWLVLVVVILRFLLRKAPKWIHCLLWGSVAFRLIMPFSLESALSLIPSTETINTKVNYGSLQIETGIFMIDRNVNEYFSDYYFEGVTAPVNNFANILSILSLVWMTGIVIMAVYAIVSYYCLYQKVKVSLLYRDNIYYCDDIDSPFILGILKPRIYLPSDISENHMGYVIEHEKAHLKRKDYFWKLLGFLLVSFYWFQPVMWVAYSLFCRDMELACDEKVIKNKDKNEKKEYCEALIACNVKKRTAMAYPVAFGEIGVKDRIKSVLKYEKPAFWIVSAAIMVSIVVAVCFLTNPMKNTNERIGVFRKFDMLFQQQTQTFLYEAYFSEEEEQIVVKCSPDGGQKWISTMIPYKEYGGIGEVYLSFVDETTGYLLYVSDPGAGMVNKILFVSRDGGRTFEKQEDITGAMRNHPCGMLFFTEQSGFLITRNYGEESYLYHTMDGGVTWNPVELEVPVENEFSYLNGVSIKKQKGIKNSATLTIEGVGAEENVRFEFFTNDNGVTWELSGASLN